MMQFDRNKHLGIISLTTWKARIDIVEWTLASLCIHCPEFHKVLVLSEDEFPGGVDSLPEHIRVMESAGMVEILWVKKNYKAFKKVLFTMQKYPDAIVISADDDCYYTQNYAKRLYDTATMYNNSIVRFSNCGNYFTQGPCTLYRPHLYHRALLPILKTIDGREDLLHDDDAYTECLRKNHIAIVNTGARYYPFRFHHDIAPIHKEYKTHSAFKNLYMGKGKY